MSDFAIVIIMQFGAEIIGFGRSVPQKVITNHDLEELFETNDDWISKRTGIRQRRVVDPEQNETATELGLRAAKQAIQDAADNKYSIQAEEIDLVICATATGDNLFPSTACLIQAQLGAVNAAAFDVSAACSGYIYALTIAYNFIKNGTYKNILIVAVDLMSKYVDWSDRRAAVIFGDGAGASLIRSVSESEDKIKSLYIKSKGDINGDLQLKNNCSYYPQKESNDKAAVVNMNGRAVYEFAVKAMPEAITEACKKANIEPKDLDFVVPHQANQRITESSAKRLGISLDKFICNIDKYGNTSAASIPLAFSEALEQGKIPRGKKLKIAMVGFGAGLTWGASIIEF